MVVCGPFEDHQAGLPLHGSCNAFLGKSCVPCGMSGRWSVLRGWADPSKVGLFHFAAPWLFTCHHSTPTRVRGRISYTIKQQHQRTTVSGSKVWWCRLHVPKYLCRQSPGVAGECSMSCKVAAAWERQLWGAWLTIA